MLSCIPNIRLIVGQFLFVRDDFLISYNLPYNSVCIYALKPLLTLIKIVSIGSVLKKSTYYLSGRNPYSADEVIAFLFLKVKVRLTFYLSGRNPYSIDEILKDNNGGSSSTSTSPVQQGNSRKRNLSCSTDNQNLFENRNLSENKNSESVKTTDISKISMKVKHNVDNDDEACSSS